jgi:hypothetical protein
MVVADGEKRTIRIEFLQSVPLPLIVLVPKEVGASPLTAAFEVTSNRSRAELGPLPDGDYLVAVYPSGGL